MQIDESAQYQQVLPQSSTFEELAEAVTKAAMDLAMAEMKRREAAADAETTTAVVDTGHEGEQRQADVEMATEPGPMRDEVGENETSGSTEDTENGEYLLYIHLLGSMLQRRRGRGKFILKTNWRFISISTYFLSCLQFCMCLIKKLVGAKRRQI